MNGKGLFQLAEDRYATLVILLGIQRLRGGADAAVLLPIRAKRDDCHFSLKSTSMTLSMDVQVPPVR